MNNCLEKEHTTISVGVDVSKDQLDVEDNACRSRFPSTSAGFRRFYRILKNNPLKFVCLEATGGYEKPLVKWLQERNIPVAVVNPRQIRDFARAAGQLAKTDAIDAHIIAWWAVFRRSGLSQREREQAVIFLHPATIRLNS